MLGEAITVRLRSSRWSTAESAGALEPAPRSPPAGSSPGRPDSTQGGSTPTAARGGRRAGVVRTRSCTVRSIGPPAAPAPTSSPPPSSSGTPSPTARTRLPPSHRVAPWRSRSARTAPSSCPTTAISARRASTARAVRRGPVRCGDARPDRSSRCPTTSPRRAAAPLFDDDDAAARPSVRPGTPPAGPSAAAIVPDEAAHPAGRYRADGDHARRRRGRHRGREPARRGRVHRRAPARAERRARRPARTR